MKAAGIILAGGLSRRMGGQEKSLLSLDGKTPVEWVAQGLRRQVDAIALNANGDPARFKPGSREGTLLMFLAAFQVFVVGMLADHREFDPKGVA